MKVIRLYHGGRLVVLGSGFLFLGLAGFATPEVAYVLFDVWFLWFSGSLAISGHFLRIEGALQRTAAAATQALREFREWFVSLLIWCSIIIISPNICKIISILKLILIPRRAMRPWVIKIIFHKLLPQLLLIGYCKIMLAGRRLQHEFLRSGDQRRDHIHRRLLANISNIHSMVAQNPQRMLRPWRRIISVRSLNLVGIIVPAKYFLNVGGTIRAQLQLADVALEFLVAASMNLFIA